MGMVTKKSAKRFIRKEYKWLIGILEMFIMPLLVGLALSQIQRKDQFTQIYDNHNYGQNEVNYDEVKLSKDSSCIYSIIANRTDAFRCFVDSTVRDPCFINPIIVDENIVYCMNDPESKGGIFRIEEIEVSIKDFIEEPNSRPWFVVLEGGSRCVFVTGATYTAANKRYNYSCSDEKGLYGSIDKSLEGYLWSIGCSNGKDTHLEQCRIKEVWY